MNIPYFCTVSRATFHNVGEKGLTGQGKQVLLLSDIGPADWSVNSGQWETGEQKEDKSPVISVLLSLTWMSSSVVTMSPS